jgi:hypothetical protein
MVRHRHCAQPDYVRVMLKSIQRGSRIGFPDAPGVPIAFCCVHNYAQLNSNDYDKNTLSDIDAILFHTSLLLMKCADRENIVIRNTLGSGISLFVLALLDA